MASWGREGVVPLLEFEVVLPCLVLAWGPLGGAPRQVLASEGYPITRGGLGVS